MHAEARPYHLVYPPNLRDWPPLASFRSWLYDELDTSLATLRATVVDNVPETRAPVPALARKAAKSRAVNAQEKEKRAGRR